MNFTGRKRRPSMDIGLWFPAVDDWKTVFYSKSVQVQRCFHKHVDPDTIMEKCKTKYVSNLKICQRKKKQSNFFKHHLDLEENLKRLFPLRLQHVVLWLPCQACKRVKLSSCRRISRQRRNPKSKSFLSISRNILYQLLFPIASIYSTFI